MRALPSSSRSDVSRTTTRIGRGIAVYLFSIASTVLLTAVAQAQQTEFGAETSNGTFLCLPSCTSGNFAGDGGYNANTASSMVNDARGYTFADANLVGGLAVPDLGVYASGANLPQTGMAQGTASAIQGYTYNGAAPATFTLNISLDTNMITNVPPNGFDLTIADVGVFVDDANFFYATSIGDLFESGTPFVQQNGGAGDAYVSWFFNSFGFHSVSAALTFDLNPGDQVYLFAALNASGFDGAVSDASNTLSMSFVDGTGLTPAVVPEPTVALLLGLGLGGLALQRREAREA